MYTHLWHVLTVQQADNLNDATTTGEQAHWLRYGKACIIGASNYYHATVMQKMGWQVQVWKAAELCNPLQMCISRFSSEYVRTTLTNRTLLQHAPALGLPDINELLSELCIYKSLVVDLAGAEPAFNVLVDTMGFWRANMKALPTWVLLVRIVVTMPTSSAASERAFSVLNNTFNDNQISSLQDQVSTACMLQYNKRALM